MKQLGLEAQALSLARGHTRLFSDLSFSLTAGETLVLRGPNGSGKTSLLRVLAGLTRADEGTVNRTGSVLYSGHAHALKDDLTVVENLSISVALDGLKPGPLPNPPPASGGESNQQPFPSGGNGLKPSIGEVFGASIEILSELGLASRQHLPVKKLSQGQKRRVGLARMKLAQKNIWLLDEPTNALDDKGVAWFIGAVQAHVDAGGIAVIASHLPITITGVRELQMETQVGSP